MSILCFYRSRPVLHKNSGRSQSRSYRRGSDASSSVARRELGHQPGETCLGMHIASIAHDNRQIRSISGVQFSGQFTGAFLGQIYFMKGREDGGPMMNKININFRSSDQRVKRYCFSDVELKCYRYVFNVIFY